MTKNDHFETQKCHFLAFLAFFKISFSSLQNPTYDRTNMAIRGPTSVLTKYNNL